ncbi:MAG: uroporphyrinogen-III synthase [Thermoleophilia bacterium]|nr:uroporphyrinogen-III synthase [Thermoleophilia bacterium]
MRFWLTGLREEPLAGRLRGLGHEAVHLPLVRVEAVGDGPVDVGGYDWVVVTSVTGAQELRRRMRGRPGLVAAIGAATAEALGGADLVPRVSTQEGLLAELPRPAGRVLFAGAEGARRLLVEELGADFVPLYRTVELAPEPPGADVAVLGSASAARALGAIGAPVPAVSIGPQTTRAAQVAGVRIAAEAKTHDVEGLVEACSSLS